MAIAIAPTDAARRETDLDLDFPPTWLAFTKVVLMVVFLVAVVLALPAAAVLALQSLLS